MNKLITGLMLVTGLMCFSMGLSAQPTFEITPQNATAEVNQEFTVSVRVTNFTNIISFQYGIIWNADVLDIVAVEGFTNLLTGFSQANFGLPPGLDPNSNLPANRITLSWLESQLNPVTLPAGTVLYNMRFRAKKNCTSQIAFTNTLPPGIEVIDATESNVGLTPVNAMVTVGGGTGPDCDGPPGGDNPVGLSLSSHTVAPGSEVCVRFSVRDFVNILGMQLTIDFDPNALEFKSLRNFNLNGLDADKFTLPGGGMAVGPGKLTLSWDAPGAQAVTLSNGIVIFEICFTAKNAGTTNVRFGTTPTALEVTQRADNEVGQRVAPTTTTDGVITISTQGGGEQPGPDPGFEGFGFILNDAAPQSGEEFCLELSVQDFEDIVGFQFSINYDAALLDFVGLRDMNLQGLDGGNPSAGNVTVLWTDPQAQGRTLADGFVLMRVCFRAKAPNGTVTFVSFSGTPTAIDVIKEVNGNSVALPLSEVNFRRGRVNIGGGSGEPGPDPGFEGFGFILNDAAPQSGEEFCLELSVQDFEDIVGFQFSINYDAALLDFVGLRNMNLPGLDGGNPSAGNVTVLWTDPQAQGRNLDNGFVLMRVCFRAKAPNGTVTFVSFSGNPTAIDVIKEVNGNSVALPLSEIGFRRGRVSIGGAGNAPTIATPATITNAKCFGEASGAISIQVQGGTGEYTYRWSFQNATTKDLQNIPAGEYTVTVTDAGNNQTATGTFTVGQPPQLKIDNINVTQVSCNGASTGAIQITASGGTGNLTYTWNRDLPNGPNQMNIPAFNNYRVTVTDANGCTVNSNAIQVTQPTAITVTQAVQASDCVAPGQPGTGSVALTINGGATPYKINWAGTLPDDTNMQANLPAGSYGFTITDNNNCTFTGSATVEQKPIGTITMAPAYIDAGNDGGFVANISGVAGEVTYQWTGPNGFTATTKDIANLSALGEYCLRVTDANGCFAEACATLYNVLKFDNLRITNACPGASTGSVSLQVTGGLPPYQYAWSNSSSGTGLTNVAPGEYGLTITDAKGDNLTGSFEVNQFPAINVEATIARVTGNENNTNGSIQLNVSGGRPGYTITWGTGATGAQLSNLAVGEYCATVRDQNGCVVEQCFNITFQAVPLSFETQTQSASCNGVADAALTLNIVGGSPPYRVEFADGVNVESENGEVRREGLPGGNLAFTLRDADGTALQGTANIPQPPAIVISERIVVHDSEAPGCSGSIRLSFSGGSPGYTVRWNAPNMGPQIINLCEGEFIPTVEDARGCRRTFDPIRITTFRVDAEVSNASCPNENDGALSAVVSGGAEPYVYTWANLAGEVLSNAATLEDVLPGRYRVTVSEGSGNNLVKEFQVGSVSSIDVNVEILSNFNGFAVSCPNANDGRARAAGINGIGAYSYQWVRGSTIVGAEALLTNAIGGTYLLSVMDESGCEIEREVVLSTPPEIVISATVTDATCFGEIDGEIDVRASGGAMGTTVFSYAWSIGPNVAGSRVRRLQAGAYTVTVTDIMNCSNSETFRVREPDPIAVNLISQPATQGCNGSVTAAVTGGTAPYSYTWNSPQTGPTINNLCPGSYMVQVVDSRGCKPQLPTEAGLVADRRFPCFESSLVITPNGDGANDQLVINCINEFPNNRLQVFNRWGQLVFERQNYDNTWGGTDRGGNVLPEGAYYFVLEYTDPDRNPVQLKGSFTLLLDR